MAMRTAALALCLGIVWGCGAPSTELDEHKAALSRAAHPAKERCRSGSGGHDHGGRCLERRPHHPSCDRDAGAVADGGGATDGAATPDAATSPDAVVIVDAAPADAVPEAAAIDAAVESAAIDVAGESAAVDAATVDLPSEREPATCGDGVVTASAGEECDPPRPLASGGAPACDPTCHIPTCGNLALDTGEACDPPNDLSCDRQCQTIPVVCGDAILQEGESCDPPNALTCSNCTTTACGICFNRCGAGGVCQSLTGPDLAACNRMVSCMGANAFTCGAPGLPGGFATTRCYCGPFSISCQPSANGPCRAEIEGVAHSSDPTEVLRQINDPSSPLNRVGSAVSCMPISGCGPICAGLIH